MECSPPDKTPSAFPFLELCHQLGSHVPNNIRRFLPRHCSRNLDENAHVGHRIRPAMDESARYLEPPRPFLPCSDLPHLLPMPRHLLRPRLGSSASAEFLVHGGGGGAYVVAVHACPRRFTSVRLVSSPRDSAGQRSWPAWCRPGPGRRHHTRIVFWKEV